MSGVHGNYIVFLLYISSAMYTAHYFCQWYCVVVSSTTQYHWLHADISGRSEH